MYTNYESISTYDSDAAMKDEIYANFIDQLDLIRNCRYPILARDVIQKLVGNGKVTSWDIWRSYY